MIRVNLPTPKSSAFWRCGKSRFIANCTASSRNSLVNHFRVIISSKNIGVFIEGRVYFYQTGPTLYTYEYDIFVVKLKCNAPITSCSNRIAFNLLSRQGTKIKPIMFIPSGLVAAFSASNIILVFDSH